MRRDTGERRHNGAIWSAELVQENGGVMTIITMYNPAFLDPDTITNLFLYGTLDTPETYNARIRLTNEPVKIQFDMATTAASGPSSSLPPLAPFVQAFFNQDFPTQFSGQISVGALKTQYHYSNLDFTFSFQHLLLDVGSADYATRFYVWNSQAFRLGDSTIFDFDTNTISNIEYR